MAAEPKFREEEEELKAVLSSGVFGRSQNLAKVLQYVCGRYFKNGRSGLSEYEIAVEALGRQPSFDPTQNAAVRVEFHRLREKLQKYYETEGAGHSLKISFHPGCYSPVFVRTQEALKQPRSQEEVLPTGALAEPVAGGELPPRLRRSYAYKVVLAVGVLGAIVLVARWKWEGSKGEPVQGASAPASQPGGPAPAASNEEVRIAAGYTGTQYIDRAGKIWGPDRYFKGGQRRYLAPPSAPPHRRSHLISDQPVGYVLLPHSVAAGNLRAPPLFCRTTASDPGTQDEKAEGTRIFDILLNGHMLLESLTR